MDTTANVGFNKYDPIFDTEEFFNIKTGLNDNWDMADEAINDLRQRICGGVAGLEALKAIDTTNINDLALIMVKSLGLFMLDKTCTSVGNDISIINPTAGAGRWIATALPGDYVRQPGYAIAGGAANTYTATLNPVPTAYIDGMAITLKINVDNTGASTINVNGLGAKSIKKANGNDVSGGNLKAGSIYSLRFNGTNFILQGEGGGGDAQPSNVFINKKFTNDNGEQIGTMPNNGAVVITPGTGNQTIAQGFHDGTGYVAGDPDLVSANIKAGVNLFGVNGKTEVLDTTEATAPAAAADILNTKVAFVNGVKRTGIMQNKVGSATVITPSTVDQAISQGYYGGAAGDGKVAGDADLIASNIKRNVNIFGVVGSYDNTANAPTAGDVINGKECWANGNKVTGTLVDKVGSATVITPSTVDQTIPAGRYGGVAGDGKVLGDPDLIASNIKSGVNVFGVAGTHNAIETFSAGNNVFTFAETDRMINPSSPTKTKEIQVKKPGIYRITYSLRPDTTGYANAIARIYKNGEAYGTLRSTNWGSTYTEDLAFAANDLIQLYAWSNEGIYLHVSSFRVMVAEEYPFVVNLD